MANGVDERTVLAQQDALVERRRAARIIEVLRDHAPAPRGELDGAALASVDDFQRFTAVLDERVRAELEVLAPRRGPLYDVAFTTPANTTMHVFGPDDFTLGWVHLDNGQAGTVLGDGRMWASNSTIGPARFTVAQLGVKLRTSVPVCKLSVRAYAQYTGSDILAHRVHQPDSTEVRRAWSLGSVGVKVDSWDLDGTGYHLDGENIVDLWNRSEENPSDARDYEGNVSSSDGLIVEPIAVSTRDYAIWVTCRVGVSADPGFEVSTYATSNIGVHVPYFVVEEIVHW